MRLHSVQFSLRDGVGCAILREDALVLGLHFFYVARAFCFHQNFDAGFVNIVATTMTVVHAHDRFEIGQQFRLGQE